MGKCLGLIGAILALGDGTGGTLLTETILLSAASPCLACVQLLQSNYLQLIVILCIS